MANAHDAAPLPQPPHLGDQDLPLGGDLYGLFGQEDFDLEDPAAEGLRFEGQDASYTSGRGAELRRCVLRRCSLRGARWQSASFTDVRFDHCDLSNMKLSTAYFQRVQFVGCKLTGLDMPQAHLRNVQLRDCVMRMANLSGSKLNAVRFVCCDANEAGLQQLGEMKRVSFEQCDLTRAELMNTRLGGLDLTTCRLDGVMVTGSYELRGAIVSPLQAIALSSLLGIVIKE